MEPLLRAEGLTRTYQMGDVEVRALRGIDLELGPGELVVLLGASGSGKSTLLNIVGGLDVPSAGRILYRGRDLTTARERARTAYRRDHVGFVFQFYNLVPSPTARENVAIVTDLADNPLPPEQALGIVGLSHRLHHFPAQMARETIVDPGETDGTHTVIERGVAEGDVVIAQPTDAIEDGTRVESL